MTSCTKNYEVQYVPGYQPDARQHLITKSTQLEDKTEIIRGEACYRYSDRESLSTARSVALAMARRRAIESYQAYVNAISEVREGILKNDIIRHISNGLLTNERIREENPEINMVCAYTQADVQSYKIKRQIEG